MLDHVHAPEKPAFRRRTIASAVALLVISTGLASTLSWSDRHQLAETVISPDGWSVSFRAPAGARWVALRAELRDRFALLIPTPSGAFAKLRAFRVKQSAATDLQTKAEDILRSLPSLPPHAIGSLSVVWRDKKLGPYEALELWEPGIGLVLRIARVRNGEIYAVSFGLLPSSIDPDSYGIFDQFCHWVEDR